MKTLRVQTNVMFMTLYTVRNRDRQINYQPISLLLLLGHNDNKHIDLHRVKYSNSYACSCSLDITLIYCNMI